MKQLDNIPRVKRLITNAIDRLDLDLSGMTILTEAASGNFVVTPLIAALAGAEKVYVVSRDSRYGTVEEILDYLKRLSVFMGIDSDRIEYVFDKDQVADKVNIVTNSGHVRPINKGFIQKLNPNAVIPLMFESWEFRHEDIDLDACIERNIPILGTNERDHRIHIFRYVGILALKLLLEAQIEVYRSKILLFSSGEYLREIETVLKANGARITAIDTLNHYRTALANSLYDYDAIIVAEQKNDAQIIGNDLRFCTEEMLKACSAVIIHIAGLLDYDMLKRNGLIKYPDDEISYGYMTVTTDYVGVKPVIELNTAGLKVGQELYIGKTKYHTYDQIVNYAMSNSPAMPFEMYTRKYVDFMKG